MSEQSIVLAICIMALVCVVYLVTNLIGLRMQIKAWERAQKQEQKSKSEGEEDYS